MTDDNFPFKKIGIDKFSSYFMVDGVRYDVIVQKNGKRWSASYGGYMTETADTKRFAVYHLRERLTGQ